MLLFHIRFNDVPSIKEALNELEVLFDYLEAYGIYNDVSFDMSLGKNMFGFILFFFSFGKEKYFWSNSTRHYPNDMSRKGFVYEVSKLVRFPQRKKILSMK